MMVATRLAADPRDARLLLAALAGLMLCIGYTTTVAATPVKATPGAVEVHTELANLHACLPMADGTVFAGGAGGLALVDPGKGLRSVALWTALDGLPGTRVLSLLATPSTTAGRHHDTLWVGTDKGLARLVLRGGQWRVRGSVKSRPVRAMVSHGGALWAATWGDGLLRIDERTMRSRSIAYSHREPGCNHARVRQPRSGAVAEARNLTAIAVRGELMVVGTAEGRLLRLGRGLLMPLPVKGLPKRLIWHLRDGEEGMLVGTVDGLYRLDFPRVERLADGDIRALTRHDDRLLLAARGLGLLDSKGRSASGIQALRTIQGVASNGATLCAATAHGLWLRRGKSWQRVGLHGLPEGDISALSWHDGGLWAGTYHRGLTRLVDRRWQSVGGGFIDRRVNALASAPDKTGGALWVATARGLFAVKSDGTRRWRRDDGLPHDDVHSVVVLRDGGVVAGTAAGAAKIRSRHVQPLGVKQGLLIRAVWALAEDPDGDLWLGSSWGLYRWQKGKATRFSMATGHLSDDWVTALVAEAGRVWVGTYRHGVDRLDRQADGTWKATPLGGGWINLSGLRVQDGRLLAATMDGLRSRTVTPSAIAAPPAPWRVHNGVATGRDVTATIAGAGHLWVAGRRGIVGVRAPVSVASSAP